MQSIVRKLPDNLDIIIEQGAGDGVMTKALLKKLSKKGKIVLIEQNKDFIKTLRKIDDPRIQIFEGMVQDFHYADYLAENEKADVIISSIPFSFLKKGERKTVVKNAAANLHKKGTFIVFHQYNVLMKDIMSDYFLKTKMSFVLRNLFPCFVIYGKASNLS